MNSAYKAVVLCYVEEMKSGIKNATAVLFCGTGATYLMGQGAQLQAGTLLPVDFNHPLDNSSRSTLGETWDS